MDWIKNRRELEFFGNRSREGNNLEIQDYFVTKFSEEDVESYFVPHKRAYLSQEDISEYGFETPGELEAFLKEYFKNDRTMVEFIKTLVVAAFKNRPDATFVSENEVENGNLISTNYVF